MTTEKNRALHGVEVTYWGNHSNSTIRNKFKEITENDFLPYIGCSVELCGGKGWEKTALPPEDGRFYIYEWSSPVGRGNFRESTPLPGKMWGVACKTGYWNSFLPSNMGTPIVYDGKYTVAELINNALYICLPLASDRFENGAEIYCHILQETLTMLDVSPEALAKRTNQSIEDRQKCARKNIIKFCSETRTQRIAELKKEIEDAKEILQSYRQKMISLVEQTKVQSALLAGALSGLGELNTKIEQMFDSLVSAEQVVHFEYWEHRHVLDVYTDMLYARNIATNTFHEIGEFKISFNLNSGAVQWHNLTRKVEIDGVKYQAPHISFDGKAMPEINADENFAEMITAFDFVSAVALAINVVNNLNADGSDDKLVSHWPVVTAKVIAKRIKKDKK